MSWRTRRSSQGRTGELLFVTVRSAFTRAGAAIATEEQDIVYRSGAPAAAVPPRPRGPSERRVSHGRVRRSTPNGAAGPAPWQMQIDPDPVLLFRFSALTYNAHRIHYDAEYATGVEGHRGWSCTARCWPCSASSCRGASAAAAPVTHVSFRARSPVFVGSRARSGGPATTGCAMQVAGPDRGGVRTLTRRSGTRPPACRIRAEGGSSGPADRDRRPDRRAAGHPRRGARVRRRPRSCPSRPNSTTPTSTRTRSSPGLKRLGVFGLCIAEEYGGLGESLLTYALVAEEIARGWMSISGIINTHFIVAYLIARHGTGEQKAYFLPSMAAGRDPGRRCPCRSPGSAPTWPRSAPRHAGTATTTCSAARRCG